MTENEEKKPYQRRGDVAAAAASDLATAASSLSTSRSGSPTGTRDGDEETGVAAHQQGPTLLPAAVAKAVSLAARSTGFAVRLGSLFGTYGLGAARFTTLSSLELARGVVEGVLTRASRETIALSKSDLAVADAETTLERSLEALHSTVNRFVFWTSAGFQLTGATLSTASEASQLLLFSLDQLLGSTDSSRAIASIITLIRRELYNPATGRTGEKVTVTDLVLALGALAYLQQACRRSQAEEMRRQAYEEVIWDVVVLNDGQRVDVEADSLSALEPGQLQSNDASLSLRPEDALPPSLPPRPVSSHSFAVQPAEDDLALSRLKRQLASTLPSGASISISNSVSTVQTIVVNVDGPQLVSLPALPGAEIVETKQLPGPKAQTGDSSYRIVYKIERNKFRTASLRPHGPNSPDDELENPTFGPFPKAPEAEDCPSPVDSPPLKSPIDAPIASGPTSPTFSEMEFDLISLNKSPTEEKQLPQLLRTSTVDSPTSGARIIIPSPAAEPEVEHAANQKKARRPLAMRTSSRENFSKPRLPVSQSKKTLPRTSTEPSLTGLGKGPDVKSSLKQVFKGSSHSLSNIWHKDSAANDATNNTGRPKPQWKTPGNGPRPDPSSKAKGALPRSSQASNPRAPPGRRMQTPEPLSRSSSRSSFTSAHVHVDQYSLGGTRSNSPTFLRTDVGGMEQTMRARWEGSGSAYPPPSPSRGHHRSGSHVPSIYSLATNDSQTSLVLSSYYQKSAYSTADALNALRSEGYVDGSFPSGNLLRNITRYMRFSSAAYGSQFLKVLGISKEVPTLQRDDGSHRDVRHFAHHTESSADNVLLASFVDPQGGTDSTGSTGTGVPLVHYISLDHEAKAVVLACRGTLGFEDVLADMACDYDMLRWRGRSFKVHKGVHASARRLIYGDDGRVLVTLNEALLEFPDYGIVMCGHSLGGAVTSLLGVMLSEPNPNGKGFVTSPDSHLKQLTDGNPTGKIPMDIRLPPRRRIHVYAYGSPGCMSRPLCKLTKGLITSVVHGNDLVPHLSLGVLHDMQAAALSFKDGENTARAEIRARIWSSLQGSIADKWYGAPQQQRRGPSAADEEQWMEPALASLRDVMRSEKLMPPGEVFVVESQRVLRRDAFLLLNDEELIGRPARRVVLKYVKDVETRFGEVRFGTSMLIDHSPAKYEEALNKLRLGVSE